MICPFDLDAMHLAVGCCRGPRHPVLCPKVRQALVNYMEEEGFSAYHVLSSQRLGTLSVDGEAFWWHLSCYRFVEPPVGIKSHHIIMLWRRSPPGPEWMPAFTWWVEEGA